MAALDSLTLRQIQAMKFDIAVIEEESLVQQHSINFRKKKSKFKNSLV